MRPKKSHRRSFSGSSGFQIKKTGSNLYFFSLRVAFASAPLFLQRTPADSAAVRTSRLDGRNPEINFKGEKLGDVTHQSTDHKAQLSKNGECIKRCAS